MSLFDDDGDKKDFPYFMKYTKEIQTTKNNKLLDNCSSEKFTNLDLSGCHGLETVLAEGTKLTGVALPNGGHLKTLKLPATIANLTIQN